MTAKRTILNILYNFVTVWIVSLAYCFFQIYVVNGDRLKRETKTNRVSDAIDKNGGIYMYGKYMPLYAVCLIEWAIAFIFEMIYTKFAFDKAMSLFKFRKTNKVILQTAITSCMVGFMVPTLSFLDAFTYYNYKIGFNFLTIISNWIRLICYNLPFGFFLQLFIVQPLLRTVFGLFGHDDVKKYKSKVTPINNTRESEIINLAMERIEDIKKNLIIDITKLKTDPNTNDLKTLNDDYYRNTYYRTVDYNTTVYIANHYTKCEYSPYGYNIVYNIERKTLEYTNEYNKVNTSEDAANKV